MRIKEVIKEKNTTVQEVAEKMGIKSPSLSRAINGNPTRDMLERIATVLEVPVGELFDKPENNSFCPHCGNSITIILEK